MAVAFDSATSSKATTGTSLSWTHTPSGTPTSVVVGVGTRVAQATGVTYGGTAMTLVRQDRPGTDVTTSLWFLASPASGNQTVAVTTDVSQEIQAGAITLTGANTYHNATGDTGSSATASVNVTSASGELVVDVVNTQSDKDASMTVGADQTERWDEVIAPDQSAAGSTEPGASSVTMSWSWTDAQVYAHTAVSVYSTSTSTSTTSTSSSTTSTSSSSSTSSSTTSTSSSSTSTSTSSTSTSTTSTSSSTTSTSSSTTSTSSSTTSTSSSTSSSSSTSTSVTVPYLKKLSVEYVGVN